MRSRYEILEFSTYMPVHCSVQQLTHLDSHLHDFFELILILEGQCRILLNGKLVTMEEGDLVAVDPHVQHELNSTGCSLLSVQFEQSVFEKTLPHPMHPNFECNSALQGNNSAFDALRRLMAQLVKNNADKQTGYELRNWSLVYEIMDVMFNNFRVEDSKTQEVRAHRYADRIARITQIISAHYTENFTLGQLAEEIHLSVPYLSKFFDQQFGMTFLTYLTQIRLTHAVDILLHSEKPIEQVSAESGFPNSHAFVQVFKKEYGLLPSAYRRKNRLLPTKETSVPLLEQHSYMAGLRKYLDTPQKEENREQVISKYISCDARTVISQLQHTWKNLMTVGSAADLLSETVRSEVRKMQQDVDFRYIKLAGVFSDDLRFYSETKEGKAVYNFAYLDEIFDFLKSVHLKPLIQLSFMPRQMAKDPSRFLFNYLVSEPKDLQRWEEMVGVFTRHLIARYGAEEIRSWLFCPWHQPDTIQMYGFRDSEAFFAFYQASRNGVKKCDAAIPFGLPPTFYILQKDYINWYIPFLDWCSEQECSPDFLCFDYYDTIQSTVRGSGHEMFGFIGSMTLRDAPDGLSEFIMQVRRENRDHKQLPIYLAEWNTSPSQQDLLNDTCFKSCYLAKNLLENMDSLDGFGYWSLTDRMGEAPLPAEMFFGGLGLFTANGIPKAAYYALSLMARLGNQLISRGDGWFLTKNKSGFQAILYNYRHFSQLYASGEIFDMTFHERYTPFAPEQAMDFHIRLSGVENGNYTIRETVVSRRYGSAFDEWLRMGGMELQDPKEVECLRMHATPHISKYTAQAKRHTLELDAMLEMLEVRLIEIQVEDEKM